MTPQVLFISQNSRTRRLYHRLIEANEEFSCECIPARSVADGLAQAVIGSPDIIIFDDSLPVFELQMFTQVLESRGIRRHVPFIVIGFANMKHIFPKDTRFATSEQDFAIILAEVCGML